MYVSENVKDGLRGHARTFVLLEALEVAQPMNPGDGRIDSFGSVELDHPQDSGVLTDNMNLVAQTLPSDDPGLMMLVELANNSQERREISLDQLTVTLFAKIRLEAPLRVSDGPSEAVISTSVHHLYRYPQASARLRIAEEGQGLKTYAVRLLSPEEPAHDPVLEPGASYRIRVVFDLPKGEYDFMSGYGGGVHVSRLVVSNMVALDIDSAGRVQLPKIPGRE